MDPPGLLESIAFYPVTLLALIVSLAAVLAGRRRVRHVARTAPPADATWFVPIYVWGIESVAHAHWWAVRASFRGIAANLFLIGSQEAGHTAFMLAACGAACFGMERLARRAGLRARCPQATLPLPVVAAILAVVGAWGLLIAATCPMMASVESFVEELDGR